MCPYRCSWCSSWIRADEFAVRDGGAAVDEDPSDVVEPLRVGHHDVRHGAGADAPPVGGEAGDGVGDVGAAIATAAGRVVAPSSTAFEIASRMGSWYPPA